MKKLLTYCGLLYTILSSCDKPDCKNKNPIFDANLPFTTAYKKELVRQIRQSDLGDLSYWVHSYKETNGIPYLEIDIVGKNLCATGNWSLTGIGVG